MSDLPQLSSQLGGPMGGTDTSTQMLGLMGDLAQNFRSAMDSASEKQNRAENLSAPKKKAPEPPKAEAAEKRQESASAEAEEQSAHEVEASEESEAPAVAEAEVEQVSEAELAEPELPIEEAKAPVSEPEADIEAVKLDAPDTSSDVELADEAAAEIETAEASESQEADLLEEAPEQAEAAAIEAQSTASEEGNDTEKLAQVREKRAEGSKRIERPEQSLAQEAEASKADKRATQAKQPELQVIQPEAEGKARAAEEAPPSQDFHSIEAEPELEEPRIMAPKDQTNKVREGLEQIAAQTQVQAPKTEQISQKLMDGLKAINSQMAKSLEPVAKPASPAAQTAQVAALAKPAPLKSSGLQPSQAGKPVDRPAEQALEERIENMKAKLVDQIRYRVKMALRGKIGEIKLHLKPKFLGTVKIQIQMEESAMKAHFVVDNQSVKDLLNRSQSALQDSLSEQGIELNELEIEVAGDAMEDGGNGKAFASLEDQKAVRQWFGSMKQFGEAALKEEALEPIEEERGDSAEESLNVIA